MIDRSMFQFLATSRMDLLKVYPRSFCQRNGLTYGLIRDREEKKLVVVGEKRWVMEDSFEGTCHHDGATIKICNLSPGNTERLLASFPYTQPTSLRKFPIIVETDEDVRLTYPGFIRAVREFDVRPVFAGGINEKEKNLSQMIRSAAWAVFQEGYREGYGAGSGPVKSLEEVREALGAGVSVITLDLSEKVCVEAREAPREWVERRFQREVDPGDAEVFLHLLTGREFSLKGLGKEFSIRLDEEESKRNVLLFHDALDLASEVYDFVRSRTGYRDVTDFQISFSKLPFPISPENHLFLSITLRHRGVRMDSFDPGFDRGGLREDGNRKGEGHQVDPHFLIPCDYGGYKISIRSGIGKSSNFSFPMEWAGSLHVKIGKTLLNGPHVDPTLLEEMENLRGLLEAPGRRTADQEGESRSNDRMVSSLVEYEEDYWSLIQRDIECRLVSSGLSKKTVRTL
jgi:tagaturonate epimerase